MDSQVKNEPQDGDVSPRQWDALMVKYDQMRLSTPPPRPRKPRHHHHSSDSSPAPPRQKPRTRCPRKRPDEAEEVNDDEDDLPMVGGGGSGDVGWTHIVHPLWRETFDEMNEQPYNEKDCFGCNEGLLGVIRLPYQEFQKLSADLPNRLIELGLKGACRWAGAHFKTNVVSNIRMPAGLERRINWHGVGIVWHFTKHSHIAQFRVLMTIIELEDTIDRLIRMRLWAKPHYGNAECDGFVDVGTLKQIASLQLLVQRLRGSDPKKMVTYHPGISSSANQMSGRVHREVYTGSNILHG